MSVRGNAAPRGMTAHDRIRLTGPSAESSLTAPAGKASRRADHFHRLPPANLYHHLMLRVKLLDPAAARLSSPPR